MTIEASDSRTPAEKAQADATLARTTEAANLLQKERLTREEAERAAHERQAEAARKTKIKPKVLVIKPARPITAHKPKLSHPDKPPKDFVAVVPGTQKPHKPTPKKKIDEAKI